MLTLNDLHFKPRRKMDTEKTHEKQWSVLKKIIFLYYQEININQKISYKLKHLTDILLRRC